MKKLFISILILLAVGDTSAQEQTPNQESKKNVVKVDFLTPLFGSTCLSYERSIRPGVGLEGTIGLIGLGADMTGLQPKGGLVKFGPRFMHATGNKSSILRGTYLQPQIILGAYESQFEWYPDGHPSQLTVREQNSYINIMLVLGKQMVFSNVFAIDYYCGFGYGFTNIKTLTDMSGINGEYEKSFAHTYGALTVGDESFPLAISAGIKLGYLFK